MYEGVRDIKSFYYCFDYSLTIIKCYYIFEVLMYFSKHCVQQMRGRTQDSSLLFYRFFISIYLLYIHLTVYLHSLQYECIYVYISNIWRTQDSSLLFCRFLYIYLSIYQFTYLLSINLYLSIYQSIYLPFLTVHYM